MSYIIACLILLLSSALLVIPARKGSPFWDRLSLAAGLGAVVLGFIGVASCLNAPDQAAINTVWNAIGGRFALRLTPLSAVFTLPALLIFGCAFLYGTGYWPAPKKPGSSAWIRFFLPLLMAGIILLLIADNGLLFLIGWEIMALSGYFLVVTESRDEEVRRAGFIYLGATHTGTLALFGLFALLGEDVCLYQLPVAGTLPTNGSTAIILCLALLGFGFKAGIMPLHIWLPRAHAAAPSHVSAVMSGVMIKTGIYGLLRISGFFHVLPPWWGWLIFSLGLISSILGVVFAIAQHDLKRLLAYHSVENIGIILIGSGAAFIGRSFNIETLAVLGQAGAMLHVVNHGLFKALLFLSAGSVIQTTGTKQMSSYGGLMKAMPLTGFFFLGGAIAICGLPPLNGFVSEWLIYFGLMKGGLSDPRLLVVLLGLPGLAMTGALALLCFAKVFGLCFLGAPRTAPPQPSQTTWTMHAAMGVLLAVCIWIGVFPQTVAGLLNKALPHQFIPFTEFAPVSYVSLAALLLLGVIGIIFLMRRSLGRTHHSPLSSTWGCGFNHPLPRAQYSTSSFAEMLIKAFHWVLFSRFENTGISGLFPGSAKFRSHTPDFVLDLIIIPLSKQCAGLAQRCRRAIQHGMIGLYLLYTGIILCILLLIIL